MRLPNRISLALVSVAFASTALPAIAQELPAEESVQAPENTDMQALVDEVGEVAQKVSAKNEEVKQLEDDFAAQQAKADDLAAQAQAAAQAADAARGAVGSQQAAINGLAQSRYRGAHRSAATTALESANPQEAVERLGYLSALSRDAHRELSTMTQASQDADTAHAKAVETADAARAEQTRLEEQRARVVKEKEAIEAQQRDIEARVDALNEEQRAQWEAQFGGVTREIDPELLARLAESGVGGRAAAAALTKQGAPYGWGATGPDRFDCSGLMVWAYAQEGKSIPRTSQAQLSGGTPVPMDQLEPGDVIGYYPGVTHVGMYIGDGQVVHASTYGVPVQVVPVDSMPVQGAVRF